MGEAQHERVPLPPEQMCIRDRLGPQRLGDAAEMALIEFVKAEDPGYKKSKGRRSGARGKRKKPAEQAAEPSAPEKVPTPEAPAAPEGEAKA